MQYSKQRRRVGMVVIRYLSLFTAVALCAALFAQISVLNPFATHAKFSVDSEADTSQTAHPELLHPRLSLSSAVATIEPDTTAPRYSLVDINFYSFPFTQQDVAAARRGKIDLLNSRWHATASTNPKSADFNGGAWASIQITL